MSQQNEKELDSFKEGIKDPHDLLFKSVFSDPKEAASVLQKYLPPAIVEKIDWDSLRLTDKEYVEENLKKSSSDLLYEVRWVGPRSKISNKSYFYMCFGNISLALIAGCPYVC